MFGLLRKKLKESVDKLTQKAKEKQAEAGPVHGEKRISEPLGHEKTAGKGGIAKIRERITTRQLTDSDIDSFFSEIETDLLQANVAYDVIEFLKKSLKEKLASRSASRLGTKEFIRKAFEESLLEAVDQGGKGGIDLLALAKKSRPLKCVFLGFNGSGKTTCIAKVAHYLKAHGLEPVIAAGDTFRAASIEQLEVHASKLDVKLVKHQYGADAAAVIFDAIKYAESRRADVVLADTAGRVHTDRNLMDELKKIVRVNKPDLKILVVDSLTGNDAVEQARRFNEAVGVDAVILTKLDINEKGGAILSVSYVIKKPVLFLGTGQGYDDFKKFEPKEFVKGLLE
jgi:fused signal recognition particle receptor